MTHPDDPNTLDDAELMARLFPLDDAEGPALPASDAALDALVAGALSQAGGPAAGGNGGSGAGGGSASSWFARLGPALVVMGVALGGGVYWATQLEAPSTPPVAAPETPVSPAVIAPPSEPAPTQDPEPEVAPPAVAVETPDPEPAAATPAARAPRSARDLLREANALRGQGQFRQAEQMYLRVTRQHGGSSSAYVARAAAAGLRLDRLGNPRGALSLYRAALRQNPGGPLGPELRRGVALSTRRLGMRDAEARALREFISRHGSAPFARRARSRLAELETPQEAPEPQ